jgi:hypothetical protein
VEAAVEAGSERYVDEGIGVAPAGGFAGAILGPTGSGLPAEEVSFTAAWIAAAVALFLSAIIIILRRVLLGELDHRQLHEMKRTVET